MSQELIENDVIREEVMESVSKDTTTLQQKSEAVDQNWRQMREENDRYRKEAERLKRELESQRGDDELVEYKQLKQMKYDLEQQTLELRIKNKYADFDDVVNKDSLDRLAKDDPELAYAIDSASDMYTKAVAAYKMLKAKGPAKTEQPESEEEFTIEDRSFLDNRNKPRSVNSISPHKGDRPLSQVNAFENGLTKELKEQLRKEMQQARARL